MSAPREKVGKPGYGTGPILKSLFTPIKINRLTLPNRSLMGSIHLNMEDVGNQYERKAHFYAERAKNDIGLIVSAGCSPNAEGGPSNPGFYISHDDLIKPHQLITRAVHRHGGRIALQLLHFGREAFHAKQVSSSAIRLESSVFVPRELPEADIEQTITDFGTAAVRAMESGYDAIELIYSQGFLVHQFLAPRSNHRTDRWGGSFENRSRLAVRIAEEVRARVGPNFPLIFRIPSLDLIKDGITPNETIDLIRLLSPCGIDLLNVSIGWHDSDIPTIAMCVPRAGYSTVAAELKRIFSRIPVCVSNRINDPRLANQLISNGFADMVSMARPFLADPELMSKAKANRFEAVNTCIACNQSCLDYAITGKMVGCSVNPECSDLHEGCLPSLSMSRRVAVVGGGLAGMCAAVYLARRGARVVLFERDLTLGGQLRMAQVVPEKSEFAETIRYYAQALIEQGVEVRVGVDVNMDILREDVWDHVMVATGSSINIPDDLPDFSETQVYTYEDVLAHGIPVEYPTAVIGGGGVACDTALYLSAHCHADEKRILDHLQVAASRLANEAFSDPYERLLTGFAFEHDGEHEPQVTIIQRSTRKIAHRLGRTTRWIVMDKLAQANVKMLRGTRILGLKNGRLYLGSRDSNQDESIPVASIVLATGQRSRSEVTRLCQELRIPFTVIGSAQTLTVGNASITTATRSAYQAVLNLD